MELPFETDFYPKVNERWPESGKSIMGTFSPEWIIVYQAFNESIADWAVKHKTFVGCSQYKPERMTWIKTNFLWIMYRSGWATKPNQERILAIKIKRSGFEEILKAAKTKPSESTLDLDDVRLQWDPDHNPYGEKIQRRAIQLGLRGNMLQKFINEWIIDINDITLFVNEQRKFVESKQLHLLKVPMEKVFKLEDDFLRNCIGADE